MVLIILCNQATVKIHKSLLFLCRSRGNSPNIPLFHKSHISFMSGIGIGSILFQSTVNLTF